MKLLVPPVIAGVLAAASITAIQTFAPSIDGRVNPVATATDVTVEYERNDIALMGQMQKRRSCTFLGMQAFLVGADGQRVVAPIRVGESIKLRPKGDFAWGPWLVDMPIWSANFRLQVITTHDCVPFWKTETVFLDVKPDPTGRRCEFQSMKTESPINGKGSRNGTESPRRRKTAPVGAGLCRTHRCRLAAPK